MNLNEAMKEVTEMVEEGTSPEKIEEIAKLYQTQVSDWQAKVNEEEWKVRGLAIKSDLLHQLLLTH